MSYILEALKKIEQKQQREGIPRLLTIPSDAPEEQKKKPIVAYVIVAALVLNAAVLMIWWIVPWRHHEQNMPNSADQTVLQQKAVSPSLEAPPANDDPVRGRISVEPPGPKPAETKSDHPLNGASERSVQATSGESAKMTLPPRQPPEVQPRKEAKSVSTPPNGKLLSLDELPASVRAGLPELKISGHAYSAEPRFRVARVNNKIVQEGEAVSQGLKVDEIVPGGVIFTYQGHRFRVGINDNK